ncbi:MAG: DUF5665 domain-containing protein [Candidatus Curtissbacteria bacterium]
MTDKITGANKYELPKRSRKEIIENNFIGGLSWSVGVFIGLTLLGVIVGFIVSKINLVPIIGEWLGDILQEATNGLKSPGK